MKGNYALRNTIEAMNRKTSCQHCGSTQTYAMPSRSRLLLDQDNKAILDEDGKPQEIMAFRCRKCGGMYYNDGARKLPEAANKFLQAVMELREKEANKT